MGQQKRDLHAYTEVTSVYKINPLGPSTIMQILLTGLYTYVQDQLGELVYNIKTLHLR